MLGLLAEVALAQSRLARGGEDASLDAGMVA
jgi:hypothetical protein